MTERLVSLQSPSAEHFIFAESFESGSGNGGRGDRIAESVEDFNRVPFGTVRSHVMVYQLDDVASTETMRRQVALNATSVHSSNFILPSVYSTPTMLRTPPVIPIFRQNTPFILAA